MRVKEKVKAKGNPLLICAILLLLPIIISSIIFTAIRLDLLQPIHINITILISVIVSLLLSISLFSFAIFMILPALKYFFYKIYIKLKNVKSSK